MAATHSTKGQFQKGHKKIPGSGRIAGMHESSKGIRHFLRRYFKPEQMKDLWDYFLDKKRHDDIRFDAFRLALYYMYGRPPREPVEPDDRPPMNGGPDFDTSGVPTRHEPVM